MKHIASETVVQITPAQLKKIHTEIAKCEKKIGAMPKKEKQIFAATGGDVRIRLECENAKTFVEFRWKPTFDTKWNIKKD